jgi:hypothetical protein
MCRDGILNIKVCSKNFWHTIMALEAMSWKKTNIIFIIEAGPPNLHLDILLCSSSFCQNPPDIIFLMGSLEGCIQQKPMIDLVTCYYNLR